MNGSRICCGPAVDSCPRMSPPGLRRGVEVDVVGARVGQDGRDHVPRGGAGGRERASAAWRVGERNQSGRCRPTAARWMCAAVRRGVRSVSCQLPTTGALRVEHQLRGPARGARRRGIDLVAPLRRPRASSWRVTSRR